MGKELSVFIDESGDIGSGSEYYLVTFVFHDQSISIEPLVDRLAEASQRTPVGNMPFHFTPVLRGHRPFDAVEPSGRKAFFNAFAYFAKRVPFTYTLFSYSKKEMRDAEHLRVQLERDIRLFVCERLSFFQGYDLLKVYYDNGQRIVKNALHAALGSTISQNAIEYRDADPATYRLFQLADYICGIELTEIRFREHKAGPSEAGFFGGSVLFRKNYLKGIRRKRLQ